jgi:hypothetical protein
MKQEKNGIQFVIEGHVVSCNQNPETCTKRQYGNSNTSNDVNVIVPDGESNVVGKCSVISGKEIFICSHQIYGIRVEPKKEEITNPKPQSTV